MTPAVSAWARTPWLAGVQLYPAVARWRVACGAWAAAQRGRLALWLPLFMATGAASYLSLTAEPAWWAGAAACAGSLVATVPLRRSGFGRAAAAVAIATSLGFASGQVATWRAPPLLDVPTKGVILTGTVRAVEQLPQGRRITLEAPVLAGADGEAPPAARRIRVRLRREDATDAATGDRLRVRALLSRPSPPAYPGAWDLQRDSYFNGMGAYGFALGRAEVIGRASPTGALRLMQRLREIIAARIDATLDGADAAIAITLLTGNPSAVSAEDKAAFRDSGLAHLLAIAGLHIGIVMGLFFGAVRLGLAAWERAALRWPIKALAALAALASGGVYLVLTGAHVPIVRSFAMACLFTVAVLAGRRSVSLRGWALAMAAIVVIAPNEVLGVSFQMSFSAVLALIAGYEALRPALRRLRGEGGAGRAFLSYVVALALTSALAGTASAPYAAYHFGRVQIYYVLANMAAVPLTALWVMPLGLLALALMPFGLEFLALVPMAWGERAILWIGRVVSALPQATFGVPHMPGWGLVLITLGGAWLGLWRGRTRLAGVAAILAGLASPALVRPPDILVSADARLIGVRTPDGVVVEAAKGIDKFTRDAWVQFWAAGEARVLPAEGDLAGVACDARACRWIGPGGGVAWIARAADTAPPGPEACDASVVLAAAPLRLRCAGGGPAVVDRFTVWREGAQAIWLSDAAALVVSERAVRGERPWAPPPRSRNTAGLALAPVETLPGE